MATTTTVQLIGVRIEADEGIALVQKDQETPRELSWGLLHEAQQQEGVVGYVYRWLMAEFCRCAYEQRQRRSWQSPRRDIVQIVADLQAQDAREAAVRAAARKEEARQQQVADEARSGQEEAVRVLAERKQTAPDDPWLPITSWEVPQGVRFDTLGCDQGQIVEYSYGTFGRAEAGRCDPYMRVTDRSEWPVLPRFYKRRTVEA